MSSLKSTGHLPWLNIVAFSAQMYIHAEECEITKAPMGVWYFEIC